MEVSCFPLFSEFGQMAFFELIKYKGSTISTPGGTDLPEIRHDYVLEVRPGCSEFRAMKDRLAFDKLVKNTQELGIGGWRGMVF